MKHLLAILLLSLTTLTANAQYKVGDIDQVLRLNEIAVNGLRNGTDITKFLTEEDVNMIILYQAITRSAIAAMSIQKCIPSKTIDGMSFNDVTLLALSTIKVMYVEGKIKRGDWIITGVKGEHYPCKPDVFEQTYEEV